MANPTNVEQCRRYMFFLSLDWDRGNIPEDEFRQELSNLDERIVEFKNAMPDQDFSQDEAFIEKLRGKITWTNMGYQASKLNGVMRFLAATIREIFG